MFFLRVFIIMHLLDTNYENMKKKNIINKLICNVFSSCFHNYVSKNAFARSTCYFLIFGHIYIQINIPLKINNNYNI